MRSRYTFYFAEHHTVISLTCRVDVSVGGRTLRSWYVLTGRKYAGINLTDHAANFTDMLQAALHFGLHLIDTDWIDCRSLKNIRNEDPIFATDWKHIDKCEEMGNAGFMYEMNCKLYPCATYVMEEGDPGRGLSDEKPMQNLPS